MNDDPFHLVAVEQQHFNMAYDAAIQIQRTSRNGVEIKEAWDRVHDSEARFKKAFDNYLGYYREMEAEFV